MPAIEEKKIVIEFTGDREDYVNTLKALVFMLTNQNPENPPTGMHLIMYNGLLNDMLTALNN